MRDAQVPPFQNTRSKAQQSSFASWKRVLPQWICEIPIYAQTSGCKLRQTCMIDDLIGHVILQAS